VVSLALRRGFEPWLSKQQLADTALAVHSDYGPAFRAMILFAAYVGLRPGELFALERTDVREDEVKIRQNLDGTGQLKLPKNGKQRLVILPPPTRQALHDLVARVDAPWLSSRATAEASRRAACSTTGTRCARRSAARGWTSTSCGTSERAYAATVTALPLRDVRSQMGGRAT
jgi:integrase